MSRLSSGPPRKIVRLWIGRLLIAGVVVECLVLGAVHVRRWIGNDHRIGGASGVPMPGAEPREGPSPSPPSPSPQVAPTRDPGSPGERRTSADGRSDPDGGGRTGTQAAGDVRRGNSNPGPSVADGPSGGTGSSGAMDPAKAPQGAAGVAVPGMNARPLTASGAAPPGGSSTPASGRAGFPSGGTVGPSVSPPMPGMPVAGRDADASGAPKPDEDGPAEPDKPDEDGSGEDDSGADSTPPVLESLRFDPAQIEGGSVTMLTVQASDAKSAMKSVWGEVRSPNRSAALSFGSNVSGGTVFNFPISLPRSAQTGTWYVAWLSLTDGAGNAKLIQAASASAAPPGGTFAAFSSESDATPPEVLQVWFDRSAVGPGEKNAIMVQARDDRSGVASVMGACQSPSKSALIWFSGALNDDSGTWVGDVTVPKTADCGEWVLLNLAVKDKAGNTTLLQADSPLLGRAGFRVASGSDCDFAAPTLDAFDLSPAIVLSGTATEIVVTAKVYDVGSGAATMTGWFEGPAQAGGQSPKNYFTCLPDPHDPDAPWTGKIQVPQLAARGTWKVGAIRLEDKAKNSRTYTSADPVVSGRVFQVQ